MMMVQAFPAGTGPDGSFGIPVLPWRWRRWVLSRMPIARIRWKTTDQQHDPAHGIAQRDKVFGNTRMTDAHKRRSGQAEFFSAASFAHALTPERFADIAGDAGFSRDAGRTSGLDFRRWRYRHKLCPRAFPKGLLAAHRGS